jgi:hypothetical protein
LYSTEVFIRQRVGAERRRPAGVEIRVAQRQSSGADRVERPAIACQRPLEAPEEQAFGLRRQRLEGAELRDDLEDRDDYAGEEAGLAVVGPEGLLVLRAGHRENLVLLVLPRGAREVRNELAHGPAVRADGPLDVAEHLLQLEAVVRACQWARNFPRMWASNFP